MNFNPFFDVKILIIWLLIAFLVFCSCDNGSLLFVTLILKDSTCPFRAFSVGTILVLGFCCFIILSCSLLIFFQLLFELFVADFIYDCVFFSFVDHFYVLK